MSKYNEPCPVCGQSMECESFYEPRWLEEEYHTCTNSLRKVTVPYAGKHVSVEIISGHYYYEYSYGASRWTIGGHEFVGTYTNTPEEWIALQEQIDAAVAQEKANLTEVTT
jgi:hypothetical protein